MMPDHGLQQLIGAALVDGDVRAALLSKPLSLADHFGLTVPERRFVAGARARDLEHFAALVEKWSTGRPLVKRRVDADWAADVQLAG